MSTENRQRLGLDAAIAEWDRDEATDRLRQAAEEREQFIARFPPTVWPDLPLERYALGLPDSAESFSHWLEYETVHTGSIKGGSAHKHLVYRRQSKPGWYYQANRYSSEREAWDAIRHGFADLVRLGAEGRWSQIDEIEALWEGPAMRVKTAWMYFPDQLLPVYSERHLDFFIRIFGFDVSASGVTEKNRRLFEGLTGLEVFDGWSPVEIMVFLYSWANPAPSHQILKIAPGAGAALWPDCLTNAYIRVGWDEVGDLTLLDDVDEIRQALADGGGVSRSALTKAARGLDRLRSLTDGDIVVANRGTGAIVGIGRVNGGYQYRGDLADHRHTVLVDWFDTTEREVDFGAAWRSTIVAIKPHQYHQIIHGASDGDLAESMPAPAVPELHLQAEKLLDRSRQLIFYGPPGTGKTWSARRHAVWLLAGGAASPTAANAFGSSQQLADLETRFLTADAPDERPAWIVVANPQHWRWSTLLSEGMVDFSYGRIQTNYDEILPGDLVYGYEAAPTKAIVVTARIEHGLHTSADGDRKILIGQGQALANRATWAQLQTDPVLAESEPLRLGMEGTLFRLTPTEVARLQTIVGDRPEPAAAAVAAVPQLTRITFHPTYTYEDFIEGYKPTGSGGGGLELQMCDGLFKRVCRAAGADPARPYVLLIDEINRGNVPKIFGELITIIEADKRGVAVTLPQSGDTFVVPPNVFLVGTMNTADRSIHVLDTALRRRFAFMELLPDPGQLEGSSVGTLPLDELLRELNTLIREHVGREKQIGHAMLMNGDQPISADDDFALAFRYEILPLLQEYTYGDYGDLTTLLGDEIVDADNQTPRVDVLDNPALLISALTSHLDISAT